MNEFSATGISPRRIRQGNVAAALQALYAEGQMTRADLARRLGLNRSSSGQIVADLTSSGLVEEVDAILARPRTTSTRGGRPGIMLQLVPDAANFIGIEIGVEHITSVQIDLRGRMRTTRTRAFDAQATPVEQTVRHAVDLAFRGLDATVIRNCRGLGMSSPSHVGEQGHVRLAPIIGWRDVPLARIVQSALVATLGATNHAEIPVVIENDANAFAIGDSYKHGRAGVTLFLLMETGIGGGILIDGKLFRGGHGLAGEIGHTIVPGSGGTKLEQLIGRESLTAHYRVATGRPDADLACLLRDVRDRVPAAVNIAEDWSRNLAHALVQACRLLDPDRIVLGGSVAALYPLIATRVAAHMAEGQTIEFPAPEIVVDADPERGAAYGAACLMHQRFLQHDNDSLAADLLANLPSARVSDRLDESELP